MTNQGNSAIAIGISSGVTNQGDNAIAIGNSAASNTQNDGAIAIGAAAGQTNQGINAIAIGNQTAALGTQSANSIIINSSGNIQNSTTPSIVLNANAPAFTTPNIGLYINPIRGPIAPINSVLQWNSLSSEITTVAKAFTIAHPLNPEKYLIHACLEGPEAGVYYRGKATIKNDFVEIILPQYVDSLASDFTVNITPIYDGVIKSPYTVSDVENGRFKIYGEPGKVFWTVYGKRFDINVEPNKNTVDVQGFGPYTWIN